MKKKVKSLKYIKIYDEIVQLIKKNNLKEGDKIPSENALAEAFNVSRGTVRQAIAILREDGIIYKHQGKGNVILEKKSHDKRGLECVNVPIFDFNNVEYSNIEITVEYQPASPKMKEFLEETDDFIITLIHVKYFSKNKIIALLMYFIKYDDVKNYDLDIKSESDLRKIIDDVILRKVEKSEISFQSFAARKSVASKMNTKEGQNLMYFSEVMRKGDNKVVLYRKSYFDQRYFTFRIMRKK